MKAEIEARIAEVYPTGYIDCLDRDLGVDETYQRNVHEAIQRSLLRFADVSLDPSAPFVSDGHLQFEIIQSESPRWQTWEHGMEESEQRRWLEARGARYEVLWVYVSRIWPAYKLFYEFWALDHATQSVVNDSAELPCKWSEVRCSLEGELAGIDVVRLTPEELLEPVDTVVREIYFEDEDGNDRTKVQATNVEECLFLAR